MIGCTPPDRNIEQHDVFFGIGESVKDLIPEVTAFWPGNNKLHLDAWREVTVANGCQIQVLPNDGNPKSNALKLFFINLGGYKQNEFEEFHYKMIVAATDKAGAITAAKQTAFFRHTGFNGATAHIDDKYGVDVDDLYEITDILKENTKKHFRIIVNPCDQDTAVEDEIHLGYFKLSIFQ